VLRCHSKATRALIANLPNNAQLGGTPTIPPSYIWVHAVVWARGRGQTHRQTNVHNHYTLASCMTYTKCDKSNDTDINLLLLLFLWRGEESG